MIKKKTIFIISVFIVILSIYIIFDRNVSNREKQYILKEFNTVGQLIGTNEYVIRNGDTIMHGKFVNYNDKGSKISEGQFVDDHIYGKCIYYYDNGNVKSSYFKKSSETNLEGFWNYSNGMIERYALYDNVGNLAFLIKYDKQGVVDSYRGASQIEIYQRDIKDNQFLKLGDKLKYSYLVANIPNAKRSFIIENISADNSKVKRKIKHIPPTQIDVEEVLTKRGKNTIRSIVKYDFIDKVTPVLIDTISFDIDVH